MTRCLRLSCVALALLLVAGEIFGQGGPIIGLAPVTLIPSKTTPAVDDQVTVEVKIDLRSVTGVPPGGGTAPAVLSGFGVPVTFDRTRLLHVSVAPGQDPIFAAGLDVNGYFQ